ncbi:MAG: cation:proton antiporter, partial [Methanosarcinales archaeon]
LGVQIKMIISEVYFIFLLLIAALIAIAVRYIKLPYTIALVIVGLILGGLLVGFVLGYIAFKVLQNLDDHLIEVLLTIILAYGTFIISEYLHVSGVMGVVAAGLLIGNHGTAFAMSPTTRISINLTWEMIAFIVNSLIFLLIGMKISFDVFHSDIWLIMISIAIVLFARMISV